MCRKQEVPKHFRWNCPAYLKEFIEDIILENPSHPLFYDAAEKRIKNKKRKTERKIERLNFKNIQNVRNFF